jgi:long-chain acyl-CoA synthetase
MLVQNLLTRAAGRWPDSIALIAAGRSLTFRDLDQDSSRFAAGLRRLGIERGDRVAAMLENSCEFVIALWAALKAGAVFVPVNQSAKGPTLGMILADAGARCLITQPSFQARIAEAAPSFPPSMAVIWTGNVGTGLRFDDVLANSEDMAGACDPLATRTAQIDQDLCLLVYTSGSTGQPKGVMLTHAAVRNNAQVISGYLNAVPDDVVLCVLPLFFGYGLFQIFTGAHAGFRVVLERSFAFPVEVLNQIAKHRVTALPAVPALIARLLDFAPFADFDLSSLRTITNAAAPLPPAHIARLRETLPEVRIYSMYGLTECTRVSFMDPARLDSKIASVGQAMPNCETIIVNDAGERCAANEVGELVVRGANLMRGYWRRPEETAKVLREGPIPGEKLLYTGDLFYADADGDLFFVGRRDDVFKCRGEKVSPRQVENVLHEFPGVAEAAIVGVPDAVDGMSVKAFVVMREGQSATQEAVRKFCMGRLEPALVPKSIQFCEALPKTETGKVTRRVLREREDHGAVPCAE